MAFREGLLFRVISVSWGFLSAWGVALATVLAALVGRHRSVFYSLTGLWTRTQLALCGSTWSVKGWERLPEDIREGRQPVVFMANHASLLDPPFLLGVVPVRPVFIAKKEIRLLPLVGWAVALAGMIYIDRGSREKSLGSLRRAARRVHDGTSVVIFPEGTRTLDGELLPFKKGGFHLALDAEVPIVPLGLSGTFQLLPKGRFAIGKGHLGLAYGEPVYSKDYPDREALMAEVRRRMLELIQG